MHALLGTKRTRKKAKKKAKRALTSVDLIEGVLDSSEGQSVHERRVCAQRRENLVTHGALRGGQGQVGLVLGGVGGEGRVCLGLAFPAPPEATGEARAQAEAAVFPRPPRRVPHAVPHGVACPLHCLLYGQKTKVKGQRSKVKGLLPVVGSKV